ncbi:MAG TPA: hypothetical protein PLD47_12825 [Aggregatilineales bacterium]|nr:hypothetical protein [Anaerolineales bacterium]HRE48602.1 hypothetical protein [Aggregatilineales bacterium]
MSNIDWTPPEPRTGILGVWDKFVGPGATPGEEYVQLIGGLVLAGLLGMLVYQHRDALQWTGLQVAVVIVLGLDLIGGIITNATATAKRWYHRPGQDTLRAHLPFVAAHGLHVLAITTLFRAMDWAFFVTVYGYLIVAAVIILTVPLYLQRPMSLILFCGGFLLGMYVFPPTPGLEWFIPFFYLKLLVSHLPKEAPFVAGRRA